MRGRTIAARENLLAERRMRAGWRDAYLERILRGASKLRPKGLAEHTIRAAYQAGYDAACEALGQDTIEALKFRRAAQLRWGRLHADPDCTGCYGAGICGGIPCSCAGALPDDLRDPC